VFTRHSTTVFVRGVISGIALVWVLLWFINATPIADWIVAPLLMDDSAEKGQVIVVLGAGVHEGCVPNQNSVMRVLLAARLWREGKAPVVMFTGGTGDHCPVSTAMANLARQAGIPGAAIRTEAASSSTWENGAIVAPMLRAWGFERVLLVTDRLHMRRGSAVFSRLGFDVLEVAVPIGEGHEDNVSMLRAGLREYAALGYYRLRGWTGPREPGSAANPPLARTEITSVNTGPVVVLGASYAEGWKLPSIGSIPVINRGVTGQQSFEMQARFDSDVLAVKPRAVILWGFINDIFRAPVDNIDPALARVRESYTAMIAQARQHGIEPVLATEVTMRPPSDSFLDRLRSIIGTMRGKDAYQDRINRHVLAVNQWLSETAARERLMILQFQTVLAEDGGRRRRSFAQPDGSHITTAGYDVLTSYAVPLLEEFLVDR
jgi:uncharacterized SAM-binding protein YcdF (DUF218 family)/lysophospholipase L1-like esterase